MKVSKYFKISSLMWLQKISWLAQSQIHMAFLLVLFFGLESNTDYCYVGRVGSE